MAEEEWEMRPSEVCVLGIPYEADRRTGSYQQGVVVERALPSPELRPSTEEGGENPRTPTVLMSPNGLQVHWRLRTLVI